MITVAIVAILAAISLPSYNNYVREGRRSDAYAALSNVSLQQEKYRANNTTYGTLAQAGVSTESPDKHYVISIDAATITASGYVAVATAISTGSQAGDKQGAQSCSALTLTVASGIPAYTPAACWKK
jgi:type IV pilus assembly protein PilE